MEAMDTIDINLPVLVTGASGLVGSHAVRMLSQHFQVRALLRSSSNQRWIGEFQNLPNVKVVFGDLLDEQSLLKAAQGCQAVVHTAAIVDAHGNPADFFAVNVEGTRNMVQAAAKAGLKHFVHISSLSVITGHGDKLAAAEDSPLVYSNEPYANSKIDAEKLVMEAHDQGLIKATCLRPGFIYGPEERTWLPRLISSLKDGGAWLVDGGYRQTNVIYVENLCQAIRIALLNGKTYGEIYNLTDGQNVSKKLLCDTVCDALGIARIKRSMPRAAAYALTESVSILAPILPKSIRAKVGRYSRGAFRLMAVNQGFDISKAERELGYTDRISFKEGMLQTIAGLRDSLSESPISVSQSMRSVAGSLPHNQ